MSAPNERTRNDRHEDTGAQDSLACATKADVRKVQLQSERVGIPLLAAPTFPFLSRVVRRSKNVLGSAGVSTRLR